jgi:aspartate kinase
VRDIIRTDDNFRDAGVDWGFTQERVNILLRPLIAENSIVITQGFIGATDENESTTLGREGSDYTAAVFANMLDAEVQVIWKDVESIMNADPKQFPEALPISELSYNEVIEMAYYGAQVIHPKTIKPLQNKSIPLQVKCFFDPALPGTVVTNKPARSLPPIIVLKENQVILRMSVLDYSFIGELHIGSLYRLFNELHIRPNLTQNAAISFLAVFDDRSEKIETLALKASENFDVSVTKGLSLLTIRHYTTDLLEKMLAGKKVLLRQETTDTVQVLFMS